MGRLLGILAIIAVVFGAKSFMEHDAEKKVEIAQEMYQDGEYDAALEQLRKLHFWHSWTDAFRNEGEELREKVRKRRVEQRQQRQEEAEAREFDRQWQEDMAEEEKRAERQRRLEKYESPASQRRRADRGYD